MTGGYNLVVTKMLRELARTTVHSLEDLAWIKHNCQLTDCGVELIAFNATRNHLSLYDTFTLMQCRYEYGLYATLSFPPTELPKPPQP